MSSVVAPLRATASYRRTAGLVALALVHLAALALLLVFEDDWVAKLAYLLFWGLLNSFWLVPLRRPAPAAALSLAIFALLIELSRFKHSVLLMTITFTDLMVIDSDTSSFLLTIWPDLQWVAVAAGAIGIPALGLVWWLDPVRISRAAALAGLALSLVALVALSLAAPLDREDEFAGHNFVSKFARSGAVAMIDLAQRGVFESDAVALGRIDPAALGDCRSPAKLPNIILIHDESSFDISALPGIRVPLDYQAHFRSIDGKERRFIVEGAGGPSWFTEYNVLTGLSVRSYGRFAEAATRLANGHVERGLATALRRCGYRTTTVFPYLGGFLGARSFQLTTGIENFFDAKTLGSRDRQTDSFYYDFVMRTLAEDRSRNPKFVYVYTSANHFPWNFRYRPDRLPQWRSTGNSADIDEFIRRQELSAQDYAAFVARLKQEFPGEPFLLVRYGDHQPLFAKYLVDASLDEAALVQGIEHFDPRYFTTYYAVDAINFAPADLASALDPLDAPYLPLVVLEAAGVPLDASFAEQRNILQRCRGLFYLCNDGAEARQFNRLLIDAGMIKGL